MLVKGRRSGGRDGARLPRILADLWILLLAAVKPILLVPLGSCLPTQNTIFLLGFSKELETLKVTKK